MCSKSSDTKICFLVLYWPLYHHTLFTSFFSHPHTLRSRVHDRLWTLAPMKWSWIIFFKGVALECIMHFLESIHGTYSYTTQYHVHAPDRGVGPPSTTRWHALLSITLWAGVSWRNPEKCDNHQEFGILLVHLCQTTVSSPCRCAQPAYSTEFLQVASLHSIKQVF